MAKGSSDERVAAVFVGNGGRRGLAAARRARAKLAEKLGRSAMEGE